MDAPGRTLCPSAQPDMDGARAFAVIGGTPERPEAIYLDAAQAVTPDLLALAAPVAPAEVFRFAAPCAGRGCGHFDAAGQACRLATKTVQMTPIVVHRLAPCAIRPDCRWWQQEGASACRRCPQVVTTQYAPDARMRSAGDPTQLPLPVERTPPMETLKTTEPHGAAPTSTAREGDPSSRTRGLQQLDGEALQAVVGGYPCGYLGIEDWGLMMCYYSRQYSC